MADLIIKPASGGDSLIFQDGAGTAVATISTNNILYSKGVRENTTTATVTNGSVVVDLNAGSFFTADLVGSNAAITTFTFSNPAASGTVSAWTIKFIQDTSNTAAKTFTYPSSIHWGGGTDHVMSVANDAVDIVSFFTIDGGTTVYASIVGQAFAA